MIKKGNVVVDNVDSKFEEYFSDGESYFCASEGGRAADSKSAVCAP